MAWVAWATNLWSPCTLGVPVTFGFQETNLLRTYGGVGGVLVDEVPADQDAEGHAVEEGLSYLISGLG